LPDYLKNSINSRFQKPPNNTYENFLKKIANQNDFKVLEARINYEPSIVINNPDEYLYKLKLNLLVSDKEYQQNMTKF
jgi:hypothetical protein